jgi:transposase
MGHGPALGFGETRDDGTVQATGLWVYARSSGPGADLNRRQRSICSHPTERPNVQYWHLGGFKGLLHVDRYAGFEHLTGNGDVVLAVCWAHTRRKFYEIAETTGSPIATEALRRISELYAIEARTRGRSSAHRLAERRSSSKPRGQALHISLDAQLSRVPGSGTLAGAIRYALSRWEGLTRFLHDGRIELDTNPVERAIRPVALGRKNHLFAGSDGGAERWAIVCSLIEPANSTA